MNKSNNLTTRLGLVLIVLGLFLPTLALIPFGSIWLWQNGLILHWAAAAFLSTLAAFLLLRRLFGSIAAGARPQRRIEGPNAEPDPVWTRKEQEAWQAVLELADNASGNAFASRDRAIELGLATVETVARRLHPEVPDPLWQFTVPEALRLAQRVAARLEPWIVHNVPLGERLTVAQLRALYRWRGTVDAAGKAWDIWRIIRLANPASAATQEAREQMSKLIYGWGKEALGRRLAHAYVLETGRAAVELYGGRLDPSTAENTTLTSEHKRILRQTDARPLSRPGILRQVRNAAALTLSWRRKQR